MKQKKRIFSKVFLGLVVVFLYAPILYTIVFSFNDSKSLTKFSGFSLEWYSKLFSNGTMTSALIYTILCAVIATVVSTIIGTITAIGLSKSNNKKYYNSGKPDSYYESRNCYSYWVTNAV